MLSGDRASSREHSQVAPLHIAGCFTAPDITSHLLSPLQRKHAVPQVAPQILPAVVLGSAAVCLTAV